VPIGVGDHGIECQCLRPPEPRIVNSLKSTNLDVVFEAAALVVDCESKRLKTFHPMDKSCRLMIDVAVKELDQDTRASIARRGGQEGRRGTPTLRANS